VKVVAIGKRSLLSGLVGAILAGLTFAVVPTATVSAQIADGQIIQTPDGAVWVVDGGQLHAADMIQMEFADLLGVPVGAPASAGVMLRAVAAAPPPPSAAAPAEPPESPPAAAPAASPVRVDVIQVERPYQSSNSAGAGQEWVRMRVRITNQTDRPTGSGIWYERMRLRLADGSTVNAPSSAPSAQVPDRYPVRSIPAGSTAEGNTLFSVPVGRSITAVLWTVDGQTIEVPVQ
jgi:hypothetical protein